MELRLAKLKEMSAFQSSAGSYDYDPYMHGLANGLILAIWVMEGNMGIECPYLEAPEKWRADKSPLPQSEVEPTPPDWNS